MTEAEWRACADPTLMFEFLLMQGVLQGRLSIRKMKLLNCAIVRLVPVGLGGETMWEIISNRPWFHQKTWRYELNAVRDVVQTQELIPLSCHEAVEIIERTADIPGLEALMASAAYATFAARYAAEGVMFGQSYTPVSEYDYRLTQCFEGLAGPADEITYWIIPTCDKFRLPISEDCHPKICSLSRDIFGYPLRPIAIDPSWLTSTVVALAEGIYAEKAFDRLPILADALQDAGCANDDLLNHLRGNGPHVRGCWALDLVLGKT